MCVVFLGPVLTDELSATLSRLDINLNTYRLMKTDTVYESPEIYIIEIQGEGLLCSSTEYSNESLDENEGNW